MRLHDALQDAERLRIEQEDREEYEMSRIKRI